jgi:fructose-1,6-bisphosphatase/inositol monophosphatase family enzyme
MKLGARQAGEVAALLRQAARQEIMPRFRRLTEGAVRVKSGPLDLVTDADEAAERLIEVGLRRLFAGCLVVGEEACAADPGLLGRLGQAELAFVVDPVDGTANFAAGLPLFGCMVAAIHQGVVVAGWIHDPLGDDTAVALRGEGAWIETEAGERKALRVAPAVPVARMVGAVSWGFLPEPLKSRVTSRLPRVAATIGLRCAAHEYRLAAGGGVHFLLYNRMLPWDHAAGWLLHREAGGHAARFDGATYSPLVHSGGLIAAPDRESWQALHDALLSA